MHFFKIIAADVAAGALSGTAVFAAAGAGATVATVAFIRPAGLSAYSYSHSHAYPHAGGLSSF